MAGILHDVVDDTCQGLQDIEEVFGDDVVKLVAGVSRISYINQVTYRLSMPYHYGFVGGDGTFKSDYLWLIFIFQSSGHLDRERSKDDILFEIRT